MDLLYLAAFVTLLSQSVNRNCVQMACKASNTLKSLKIKEEWWLFLRISEPFASGIKIRYSELSTLGFWAVCTPQCKPVFHCASSCLTIEFLCHAWELWNVLFTTTIKRCKRSIWEASCAQWKCLAGLAHPLLSCRDAVKTLLLPPSWQGSCRLRCARAAVAMLLAKHSCNFNLNFWTSNVCLVLHDLSWVLVLICSDHSGRGFAYHPTT